MNRLVFLSAILLAGCSSQEVSSWVLVAESAPVSAQDFGAKALPRFIPEGTQYAVPAVGIEAPDGSFYPVLALCNPIPRGGSVGPVSVTNRRLRVFRGVDAVAANNELLGVYEIDSTDSELQIAFSVTHDGRLFLSATEPISGENAIVRQVSSLTSASAPGSVVSIAQESLVTIELPH